MELWLTVNGKRTCASAPLDPLTRAVVISLFTWRRAEPDDNADVPMGWWGDTWPAVQNDRYGSPTVAASAQQTDQSAGADGKGVYPRMPAMDD
ncbi:hypothetical protein MS6207_01473 [Escherichia coli]|nr:hypothetical protein [Escherichia coli]